MRQARLIAPRCTLLFAALAAATTAHAEGGPPCQVNPPLEKVTSLASLVVKLGGIRIDTGMNKDFLFGADGGFSARGMMGMHCREPAAARIAGDQAEGSCSTVTPTEGGDVVGTASARLTVTAASARIMLASLSWPPSYRSSGVSLLRCEAASPTCDWTFPDQVPLTQIIPGAQDQALFEAVRRDLLRAPPVNEECPAVFEGPPARKQRVESEVFFASPAAEVEAKKIAERLKPVIGPVEVKPWPGAWQYSVVVVVGSKVAASQPSR